MAKRPPRRSNSSASPSDSARGRGATGARRERQESAQTLNGPPPHATSVPTTDLNPQEQPRMASPNTSADSTLPATQAGPPQSSAPAAKRFDIFIADIGWETPVAESVRKNMELALSYQKYSTCYVLSK